MERIIGIILAILAFGFLIFIHELAHFLTARMFKVKILEFSIGMGPKLFSKTSKKTNTAYSLRLLPIGGYVSMEGEDEESNDENAFNRKKPWQRLIITAAGAIMNILVGFIIMFFVVLSNNKYYTNTVSFFYEKVGDEYSFSEEYQGLKSGDRILKINNYNINIYNDISNAILFEGTSPVDVTVNRDEKTMVIENVTFDTQIDEESGIEYGVCNIFPTEATKTFGEVLSQAFYQPFSIIKTIYKSLLGLVSGQYGIDSMSGPVGAVNTISKVVEQDYTYIFTLTVFLTMNLGLFNLLPIPALDGGRILFILIEMIIRRPLNEKFQMAINTAGMVLLLGFMLYISVFDIIKLF